MPECSRALGRVVKLVSGLSESDIVAGRLTTVLCPLTCDNQTRQEPNNTLTHFKKQRFTLTISNNNLRHIAATEPAFPGNPWKLARIQERGGARARRTGGRTLHTSHNPRVPSPSWRSRTTVLGLLLNANASPTTLESAPTTAAVPGNKMQHFSGAKPKTTTDEIVY